MDLKIEDLFKGKGTRIKDKEYFSTEQYVTPFLDKLGAITDDFRIQVKLPDQITYTKKDTINLDDITFNRVWIQAVLPDKYCIQDHDEVIGMVYGLDVRKPIVKFYRGGLNRACTNLCVFSPDLLSINEIEPQTPFSFDGLDFIRNQAYELENFLDNLNNTFYSNTQSQKEALLGKWVNNCIRCNKDYGYGKIKISETTPIAAYKDMFVKADSDYYMQDAETLSVFDIYNAFTQQITDDSKDIMNKAEKTLLLRSILEI